MLRNMYQVDENRTDDDAVMLHFVITSLQAIVLTKVNRLITVISRLHIRIMRIIYRAARCMHSTQTKTVTHMDYL